MAKKKTEEAPPVDPELLAILRCPVAVQRTDKEDPGQLTLHKGCWLVCEDSGLKYPVRNGIPVMLVDEAQRWKDTPVDELPVPPPD